MTLEYHFGSEDAINRWMGWSGTQEGAGDLHHPWSKSNATFFVRSDPPVHRRGVALYWTRQGDAEQENGLILLPWQISRSLPTTARDAPDYHV